MERIQYLTGSMAIIMIAVGTFLVALTIYRLNNPFLGLAVVWAFLGIAIKHRMITGQF